MLRNGFSVETGFGLERLEVFSDRSGWFYAFGQPGCLYDGEPVGPFTTAKTAYEAAREVCSELPHWSTLRRRGLI